MSHGLAYKPLVGWEVISFVLAVIKGATALSSLHPLVIIIDGMGIVYPVTFRTTCSYAMGVVLSCDYSG